MMRKQGRDLMHRWEQNPIITLEDVPYRCNSIFNGTPVKINGEYLLLLRIEGQQGYSFFSLGSSKDGLHFHMEGQPCMLPAQDGPFKIWEEDGLTILPISLCNTDALFET